MGLPVRVVPSVPPVPTRIWTVVVIVPRVRRADTRIRQLPQFARTVLYTPTVLQGPHINLSACVFLDITGLDGSNVPHALKVHIHRGLGWQLARAVQPQIWSPRFKVPAFKTVHVKQVTSVITPLGV